MHSSAAIWLWQRAVAHYARVGGRLLPPNTGRPWSRLAFGFCLIRRPEATDVEAHQLQAAIDSLCGRYGSRSVLLLPPHVMQHACLLCGATGGAGTNDARAAARVPEPGDPPLQRSLPDLRCTVCECFPTPEASSVLVPCVQQLERQGPPRDADSLLSVGHPQATALRGLCYPNLLHALEADHPTCDQHICDIVSAQVAPLPIMRDTLSAWVLCLLGRSRRLDAMSSSSSSPSTSAPALWVNRQVTVPPLLCLCRTLSCLTLHFAAPCGMCRLDVAWVHRWQLIEPPASALDKPWT